MRGFLPVVRGGSDVSGRVNPGLVWIKEGGAGGAKKDKRKTRKRERRGRHDHLNGLSFEPNIRLT
jgi:hypothetical protein